MKKIIDRLRLEGWKTILVSALGFKLILDGMFFWMSIHRTNYIIRTTTQPFAKDREYVGTYGWFMYVCYGVIILFDIIMLVRVILASKHKPMRYQQNPQLDLFTRSSSVKAEKFCLITMLWLLVPFICMMAYLERVDEVMWQLALAYAMIYIVVFVTIIKSRKNLSMQKIFSSDRLAYLQASKEQYSQYAGGLFDNNAVIIENYTDYMISSFATGNFSATSVIFYDLYGELMPWLEHNPQFRYDLASRRNHVVVADCKKIENLREFIAGLHYRFKREASKYACLTIGLVNSPRDITERDFDFGLAKDMKIVSFRSYKSLELLSLSAGRIPVISEIGTPEENQEAQRIAQAQAGLCYSPQTLKNEYIRLLGESGDISPERYNGADVPDYSYVLTSLVLNKITSMRIRSVYLSRMCGYFLEDPERRICGALHQFGIYTDINPNNEFLYSILKNILFEPSEVKRIMGLFDYIDFVLRTVEIYSYIKNGGEPEAYEIQSSFYKLASSILVNTPDDNIDIRQAISIPIDNPVIAIIGAVEAYFNLISSTGNIDFCGLCHLIDIVRNKTRGHGSVKEENCWLVHSFLLLAIELLHNLLRIQSFNIIVENNKVFIDHRDERYDCSEIIYAKDGLPCIPIRMQGERKEYINFFKGKYIVPDFVQYE